MYQSQSPSSCKLTSLFRPGEGIVATRPYDKQEIIHYSLPNDEALIIKTDTACEDEGVGNCDPSKMGEKRSFLSSLSSVITSSL